VSKPIRVGIIADGLIDRELDDIEFIVMDNLLEEMSVDAKVVLKTHDVADIDTKRVDLLILDYGGIAAHGAWDIAATNVRHVIQWAQDHPSSALLLWTDFTRKVYENEVKEQFGELPNIFLMGKWSMAAEDMQAAVQWLGITPGGRNVN